MGVDAPLALLIDASRGVEHPKLVGTVLAYLRLAAPQNYMKQWEAEVPFLSSLLDLLAATGVAPYIYEHHPAAPSHRAISRQLVDGVLGDAPLIALVARPLPPCPPEDSKWIEALRCWVFVQFLNAAYTDSQPNPYLISTTQQLRQGIDTSLEWFALFCKLKGPTHSFHGMTRHLATCAGALRSELPDAKRSHLEMLAKLERFAHGQWPQGKGPDPGTSRGLFHSMRPAYQANQHWSGLRPDQEDQQGGLTPSSATDLGLFSMDGADDESSACQLIGVADDETPVEQERQATGVLLATIEDRQVLPFSWNRPSAWERDALQTWLLQAWASGEPAEQELGALVWLSLHSGNSLRTVLHIELGATPAEDWRIDLAGRRLHRSPPRRHNSWQANAASDGWVAPRAQAVQVPLPDPVAQALSTMLARAPGSTKAAHLWSQEASAEQLFKQACNNTAGLQRVTSGMLSRWLEQEIFEATNDQTLALLLSSHPRSGLPAACAYSSYSMNVVAPALLQAGAAKPPPPGAQFDGQLNAAGSELDPIEQLLKQACVDALQEVHRLAGDPNSWAAHHNALVAYVVVMLLSATGARPVRSPFESIDWIDLQNKRIFVADKVSTQLHDGRLVPLPGLVIDVLENVLRPHLKRLSRLLAPIDRQFSGEVERLANWQPNTRLPLLFLLGITPELAWVEVSEKTLSALDIFKWPLPWNVMRHRLSTTLIRKGVDREIVNGLMGHAEQGTSPYGPYSMRVWGEDMQGCAPVLDGLLAELQLSSPIPPAWSEDEAAPVPPPSGGTALTTGHGFGQDARQRQRRLSHRRTREAARHEINVFLANRPIDSLSADDWERLSQQMLLTAQGLPHPMGSLRYDAMRQWISDQWQTKGLRPRLKKRYLPLLEESSPFTAMSIGAPQRLRAAASALEKVLSSLTPSQVSLRESLILGITSVACESRVADKRVLEDLARNRNYQIVKLDGRYYLEHSPVLHQDAQAPRVRHRISEMTAALLSRAAGSKIKLEAAKMALPRALHPLAEAARSTEGIQGGCGVFLESLAAIIDQVNWQEHPGLVAAYLGGHVVTAALNHEDWVRAHRGYALMQAPEHSSGNPNQPTPLSEEEEDVNWIVAPNASHADEYSFLGAALVGDITSPIDTELEPDGSGDAGTTKQKAQGQLDAHAFFVAVRKEISRCSSQKSSPRKNLDSALRRVISAHRHVSLTCRLLAEWVRSLLWRRTSNGDLTLRSVLRYFNALSACFEAVAYRHDLTACDSEAVTEFYIQIMEARLALRPQEALQATPVSPEEADTSQALPYRTWRLALLLLRSFHSLVSRELAVDDPDWSEVPGGEDLLSISPGMVLEREYQYALRATVTTPESASFDALARGFVLLLCFRFGLRGAEACGMLRSDWVSAQPNNPLVLVRANQYRSLKTNNARRQVPLLFQLSDLEQNIVHRYLALWQGHTMGQANFPLFCAPGNVSQLINGRNLRWELSKLLKDATRNPNISLHHTRHAFAFRVSELLIDGCDGVWPLASWRAATDPEDDSSHSHANWRSHVRRLLLTHDHVTHRTLWALARLLGHGHPTTAVRSYLHMVPELAERRIWANRHPATTRRFSVAALDLDQWVEDPAYLGPYVAQVTPTRTIAAGQVLRLLYFIGQGVPVDRAAFNTDLDLNTCQTLVDTLATVDAILRRRLKPSAGLAPSTSELLGSIRPTRWPVLVDRAKHLGSGAAALAPRSVAAQVLSEMVGPSRHILLHREAHFRIFSAMMSAWKIPAEVTALVSAKTNLHPRLVEFAQMHHLKIAGSADPDGELVDLQVDSVEVDDPPVRVQHRVAAIARRAHHDVASSHELVLFLMVTVLLSVE